MTDPDVMLGWCMGAHVDADFLISAINATHHPRVHSYKAFRSGPIVDLTRNMIVKRFAETDLKWLLMVDADQAFTDDHIDRILHHGDAGHPVTSGWYLRQLGDTAVPVCLGEQGTPIQEGQGMVAASSTGCGFLLIRRDVVDAIRYPWFKVEWDGERCDGEDVTFCKRAWEKGFPVMVDTNLHIGHIKPVVL